MKKEEGMNLTVFPPNSLFPGEKKRNNGQRSEIILCEEEVNISARTILVKYVLVGGQ